MPVQSYYYDILQGVVNVLTPVVGGIPINVRKRPVYLTGDPLPSIVVSPDETSAEFVEYEAFCQQTTYMYPVIVSVFEVGNRIQSIDVNNTLLLRQNIRDTLYQPTLTGALSVYDVSISPAGPYIQVEQRSNYDVMMFKVSYKSFEYRLQ
jgi:hypothetical protein